MTEQLEAVENSLRLGTPLDVARLTTRTMDISIVRKAILGRLALDMNRPGLHIKGANFNEELNLVGEDVPVSLKLERCNLPHGIDLTGAKLRTLVMEDCQIGDLDAEGCSFEFDLTITNSSLPKGLDLERANINGDFTLRQCVVVSDGFPFVNMRFMRLGGDLFLTETRIRTHSPIASISMPDASIEGAIVAPRLVVTNSGTGPALGLRDAHVNKDLILNEAHLFADETDALYAPQLRVDGQMLLANAIVVSGKGYGLGGTGLQARSLSFDGASISSPLGTCIDLSQSLVKGHLTLFNSRLSGHDICVNLGSAQLGAVYVVGTHISSKESDHGCLNLVYTRIDNQLTIRAGSIRTNLGIAIRADRMQLGGSCYVESVMIHGNSRDAALAIITSSVGGEMSVECENVRNSADGPDVDLSKTTIARSFALDAKAIVASDRRVRIRLTDLKYSSEPENFDTATWIKLIRFSTPEYAAQPYRQLADIARDSGHERAYKSLLIAQQRDLLRWGDVGGVGSKFVKTASGVLIGFGYKPYRALFLLLATLLASVILVFSAGHTDLTTIAGQNHVDCSTADALSLAFAISIPLVRLSVSGACTFTGSSSLGQSYIFASWILTLLGWSFATIFVAGYTRSVRGM